MTQIRRSNSGRGGGGRGRQYRGGRPKIQPFVKRNWGTSEGKYILSLSRVELEALYLIDKENLTQEQAAERMQISRGTFWRIVQQARKKIIHALESGNPLIQLETRND